MAAKAADDDIRGGLPRGVANCPWRCGAEAAGLSWLLGQEASDAVYRRALDAKVADPGGNLQCRKLAGL